MDTFAQEESLKQLAGLSGIEYLFTAHYGAADDFTAVFAYFDQERP